MSLVLLVKLNKSKYFKETAFDHRGGFHSLLEKWKRLDHPRQAQDEPPGKVFFTFLGGLACDLEGVGAGTRHFSNLEELYIIFKQTNRK